MPAWLREHDEVLVVGVSRRGPAEDIIRVLSTYADVEPRPGATRPLRVHRVAGAVIDERLARARCVGPPGVRLDLAHRPAPRAPRREDDVDRVDPVLRRRRACGVRVPGRGVEMSSRRRREGHGKGRSHERDGDPSHVPSVRADFRHVCAGCASNQRGGRERARGGWRQKTYTGVPTSTNA